VHIIVAAGLWVTLFFGGWQVPWLPTPVLRDNAGILLYVMAAGMAVVGFGAAALSARWIPSLLRQFTDARRFEGHVLAALFGGIGVLGLAGLAGAVLFAQSLPDWAPSVIAALVQFTAFTVKVLFFAFAFIWVRWTLPSFRYDQLMRLGWKNMMPLALANVGITGLVILTAVAMGGR
jgi:NADH-quinone oxidoreductase subunit H